MTPRRFLDMPLTRRGERVIDAVADLVAGAVMVGVVLLIARVEYLTL